MLFYSNRTTSPSIITLKIEGTDDPKGALTIGTEEFFEKFGGQTGYVDFVVGPGKQLCLINNTVAIFISARSEH